MIIDIELKLQTAIKVDVHVDVKNEHENVFELKLQDKQKRRELKQKLKYQCLFCMKILSSNQSLNYHTTRHKQPSFYGECGTCQKAFMSERRFKKHNCHARTNSHHQHTTTPKKHHQPKQKVTKCLKCDFMDNSKMHFISCLRTDDENQAKDHKCSQCEYATDFKSSLKRHLKMHKDGRRKFPCHLCRHSEMTKGGLRVHMKIHDLNRVRHFRCRECFYGTENRQDFEKHIILNHEE
jgi:hypothetical protein